MKLKGKLAYTPFENTAGENSRTAKLNEDAVRAIRASTKTNKEIGEEFGISAQHAGQIRRRKKWAHVK